MGTENSEYELDLSQYNDALGILEEEMKKNVPTKWQRRFYKFLRVCSVSIIVCPILLVLLFVWLNYYRSPTISSTFWIVTLSIFGIWALCFLLLPLSFLLNIRLILKQRRQRKLLRNLGLSKAFKAFWKRSRKRTRFYNSLDILMLIIGLLIFYGSIHIILLIAAQATSSNPSELIYRLLIFVPSILIGVAFVTVYTIRRDKERFEVIASVLSNLSIYKTEAERSNIDRINIPSNEYELMAKIERSQISQERQQVVEEHLNEPAISGYMVQKSKAVRDSLSQLAPAAEMLVRDSIDMLMTDPMPEGSVKDADSDVWHLRLPDIPAEIAFSIDEENQRVRVHYLKQNDKKPQTSPELGA